MKQTKKVIKGNSLVVQWLGLHTSTVGGMGSILVEELTSLQATQGTARKRKKERQLKIESTVKENEESSNSKELQGLPWWPSG